MTSKTEGYGWLWVLCCFFAVFFTFIYYSQPPIDEKDLWLQEFIWWAMVVSQVAVFGMTVVLLYPFLKQAARRVNNALVRRKQAKDNEAERRIEKFELLLDRIGEGYELSEEVLQSTREQATALADVIVGLHHKATELAQSIAAYDRAIEALSDENPDPIKIARAAGGIDYDLRVLMTAPFVDAAFYSAVAKSAAERASDAEDWLKEYLYTRDDLMSQLTGIMVRLQTIQSHATMTIAAKPLLVAEKEVSRAYNVLNLWAYKKPSVRIPNLQARYLKNGRRQITSGKDR